jgi:EAL domain-containing protein (putative c-di-GMP-specific phosphodiesterase class I)
LKPARFIPLAEECGLIVPIAEWVLRTACVQNRAWQDGGLGPFTVAVNVSARQLVQNDLEGRVERILGETGLSPQYLELELTEGAVMRQPEDMQRRLLRIKEAGCRISIDHFGTGYSSLSYLKLFPFDRLKIDQSFAPPHQQPRRRGHHPHHHRHGPRPAPARGGRGGGDRGAAPVPPAPRLR